MLGCWPVHMSFLYRAVVVPYMHMHHKVYLVVLNDYMIMIVNVTFNRIDWCFVHKQRLPAVSSNNAFY